MRKLEKWTETVKCKHPFKDTMHACVIEYPDGSLVRSSFHRDYSKALEYAERHCGIKHIENIKENTFVWTRDLSRYENWNG